MAKKAEDDVCVNVTSSLAEKIDLLRLLRR